jgi:cell division protein FtsB
MKISCYKIVSRKKLEEERKKLEDERKKLEDERKKLEEEKKKGQYFLAMHNGT